MINKKTVSTIIFILLILGLIYSPGKLFNISTYAKTLSHMNTDDYGTSSYIDFLRGLGYRVMTGNARLLSNYGRGDIYILMGPDTPLSREEVESLREFMYRGGGVLIADELGTINPILKELLDLEIDGLYAELLYNLSIQPGGEYLLLYTLGLIDTPPDIDIVEDVYIGMEFYQYVFDFYKVEDVEGLGYLVYTPYIPGIVRVGEYFKPIGYFEGPSLEWLQSGELDGIELTIYVLAAYYDGSGPYPGRIFVIGDTSIFTNKYINKINGEDRGSRALRLFHINLLKWLSYSEDTNVNSTGDTVIIFDDTHVEPYREAIPIPPLGRILLSILSSMGVEAFNSYRGFTRSIGLLSIPILILLITPSLYMLIRRRIGLEDIKAIWIRPHEEKRIVIRSPILTRIYTGRRDKEFYSTLILGLYDLFDTVLRGNVNLGIEDIYRDGLPRDVVKRIGEENYPKLIELVKRLSILREKILGGKILPIVLSWSREFNRLSRGIDDICNIFGIVFMDSERGKRGVEYVYREHREGL